MKKLLAILLLALLVAGCCSALADSIWYCPVCGRANDNNFCPKDGTARPSGGSSSSGSGYTQYGAVWGRLNRKLASRTGPGTVYDEAGTFLSSGQNVQVLSRAYDETNEIWWVQVRFSDRSGSYQLYTGAKRFDGLDLGSVPEEEAIGWCHVPYRAAGYYGPGTDYALCKRDVPAGVSGDVYAIQSAPDGDYVQLEFYDDGLSRWRRAWVRTDKVTSFYLYSTGY